MPVTKSLAKFVLIFSIFIFFPSSGHAENPARDASLIASGAGRIVSGVFSLPLEILKGATRSFPFGVLGGALRGTARLVGSVVGGSARAAQGAAPYAKYAALL